MASYRTSSAVPADIITYRKDGNLVFVQPAANYEAALTEARKVFPELEGTPDERISFYITATLGSSKAQVRVSESAWSAAISRLLRGEVVDVRVEERQIHDTPPRYLEVPESKEAAEFYRESRESRSMPPSRTHSRQSSPSGRSIKSQDKSSRWWHL